MFDTTTPPADVTNPSPPPPTNGEGTAGPVIDAALAARIDQASDAAVDQFLSEQPPAKNKGRGKRGPDKNPGLRPSRAKVPVATVGNGSDSALLADGAPAPLESEVEIPPPVFDQKAAAAIVDVGLRLLNKCAGSVVSAVAIHETGNKSIAADAAQAAQMEPEVLDAIKLGAMQCAQKYAVKMEYAPEVMLLGGLGVWSIALGGQISALKNIGRQLRETQEPPRQEAA